MAERPEGLRSARELAKGKPHGTRIRYKAGCSCLICSAANSRYETMRAKLRKAGLGNGIVSAAPARRHLKRLAEAGVGYKSVAAATGIASTIVFGIKTGHRPKCREETLRRILRVDRRLYIGGRLVPAGPTWKLIRLLVNEGYRRWQISRALGKQSALQLGKKQITMRNAWAVRRLYERLTEVDGNIQRWIAEAEKRRGMHAIS